MKVQYARIAVALLAMGTLYSTGVQAGFLPPNDLDKEDNINRKDANITEEQFLALVGQVATVMGPYVQMQGAELVQNNLWKNTTVNASANQVGNKWYLNMYGGLARRPEVTPDGFSMVVCHELGHHMGGYSFYGGFNGWAANEGQSDYYATHTCARAIWADDKEVNASYRAFADPIVVDKCNLAWTEEADQNLCYRTGMAGLSLAKLLAALGGGTPKFETPDPAVVRRTLDSHPASQCRLDTYLYGALCSRPADPRVIPGKNHINGQQSIGAEEVAAQTSCFEQEGYLSGNRPACWFKSARPATPPPPPPAPEPPAPEPDQPEPSPESPPEPAPAPEPSEPAPSPDSTPM